MKKISQLTLTFLSVVAFGLAAVSPAFANHLCGQPCDQLSPEGSCTHGCNVPGSSSSISITKKYILYLETPSHLRKYQLDGDPIEISEGLNPKNAKFVDFGSLIHGNLNGDNIINNLDVAIMYAAWGQSIKTAGGFGALIAKESPSVPADLNGDLTVNNRDLAILLGNFGAKAEDGPTFRVRPASSNGYGQPRNGGGGTSPLPLYRK